MNSFQEWLAHYSEEVLVAGEEGDDLSTAVVEKRHGTLLSELRPFQERQAALLEQRMRLLLKAAGLEETRALYTEEYNHQLPAVERVFSEKWRLEDEREVAEGNDLEALRAERDRLREELALARADVQTYSLLANDLRDELMRVSHTPSWLSTVGNAPLTVVAAMDVGVFRLRMSVVSCACPTSPVVGPMTPREAVASYARSVVCTDLTRALCRFPAG
jgi:hypothetical protein